MTPRARLSVLGLSNGTAHSDRYFDLDQTRVMPRPKGERKTPFRHARTPHVRLQRAYRRRPSPHLIISISKKMIERLDPDEAEARILHVGHDVERHGQGTRK